MRKTLTIRSGPRGFKRGLAAAALAATAIAAGSGAFLVDAGTALAPEPARVTQPLTGPTGAGAAAYFVNSGLQVRVFKWPGSYTYGANPPAAGTPCATTDLAAWTDTMRTIVAYGNYRKCM